MTSRRRHFSRIVLKGICSNPTCFQLGELLSFEDTGDNSATIQPKESGLTHGVFEEIVAESYIYEKT